MTNRGKNVSIHTEIDVYKNCSISIVMRLYLPYLLTKGSQR